VSCQSKDDERNRKALVAQSCIVCIDIDELQVPSSTPSRLANNQGGGNSQNGFSKPSCRSINQRAGRTTRDDRNSEDWIAGRIDLLKGSGFLFLHGTTAIVDVDL